MRSICSALALAVVVLFAADAARAFNVTIEDHPQIPQYFLAVAKDTQTFFALGRRSPLTVLSKLACSTGQESGDKRKEGDLKTPEGVYFVERKLSKGLDFKLYGDLAFTLNYPNPIDKLKGKTGRGIWIHGRGYPITPRETQGCVALNTPDLRRLEATLESGTPVVIASDVRVADKAGEVSRTAKELADRVQAWATSWERRSDDFFDFYDQKVFTEADAPSFKAFRDNKERIFASKPWIEVACFDVRALPGPDYWVTWFGQYYRTDSHASQGVKRLYWQKDAKGKWVIVGAEYVQADRDYERLYVERADKQIQKMVESWRKSWEKADYDAYARWYVPAAVQDGRQGLLAIMDHKKSVWQKNAPRRVALSGVKVAKHEKGFKVTFKQDYQSASGYADSGYKTLILEPSPIGWRIISELWSNTPS